MITVGGRNFGGHLFPSLYRDPDAPLGDEKEIVISDAVMRFYWHCFEKIMANGSKVHIFRQRKAAAA